MRGFIIFLVVTLLSATVFSFLFYGINNSSLGVFHPIREKIDNLSKKKRKNLNLIARVLVVIIVPIFDINSIAQGLILGFMFALIDICFKENVIEISLTQK